MSDDGETFRAASRLIEEHGEAAAAVASHHMTAMQEKGDPRAVARWARIIAMIEKLQRSAASEQDETG